jgi:uncharacterized protein YbjT (DUF2867 family)
MRLSPSRVALLIVASLAALSLPARADDRAHLRACQALVDRAANAGAAGGGPDEARLRQCRQIIREWTLRDSRMSVDEQGRPLR